MCVSLSFSALSSWVADAGPKIPDADNGEEDWDRDSHSEEEEDQAEGKPASLEHAARSRTRPITRRAED